MRARPPLLPRKLDIKSFIDNTETLSGQADLSVWPRLAATVAEGVDHADVPPLAWSAQGRVVPRRTGGPELWLDVAVRGQIPLTCQRCLHPVTWHVDLDHPLRFVDDENAAAELDADLDDDVLALTRHLDLLELLEDELIMDAPLVPRHDVCPENVLAWMADDAEVTPEGEVVRPGATEAGVQGNPQGDAQTPAPDEPGRKPHPFAALAALKKKPD
jgi:uncharacterized protein